MNRLRTLTWPALAIILLLTLLVSPVLAATSITPDVWDPGANPAPDWVNGNVGYFTEGEVAPVRLLIEDVDGTVVNLSVCLDLDVSSNGHYAFTDTADWNTTVTPTDTPPVPANLSAAIDGFRIENGTGTLNSVTFIGESIGDGDPTGPPHNTNFRCLEDYQEWVIEVTLPTDADGDDEEAVVVFGAKIAKPGDPIRDGGFVPPGLGAGGVNGTFQFEIRNGGREAINFTANEAPSSLIVDKVTDPPGDPQLFDFNVTDNNGTDEDFQLADATQPEELVLDPGDYTITEEDIPANWELEDITCDFNANAGSSVTYNDTSVDVTLGQGDTITCTFTNEKRGTIVIVKDADPADDTTFSFTDDIETPNAFVLQDPADDTKTFSNVTAGAYSVTESVLAGWTLDDITCVDPDQGTTVNVGQRIASIDLDPGETVTCTFVNSEDPPPPTGTIIINKVANPQDGTDFPFTIDPDAMPILYREIFPLGTYAVTQGARLNALDEGWRGYWDGRTTDDGNPAPQNNTSLQIFGPGSTAQVPVNSNPVNAGQGNAFWSPSESRVILYTEEFSFPRADLARISYETRHNDGDQPQQDFPLLKIDGKWYSPDCQYVNSDVAGNATWIPASWMVNSVTWMELDIDPATNRAVVPGQDCVQTGDFDPPLQTGLTFASLGTTIQAFGLYLPDPESNPQANMRFDNYTFFGAPTGDFTLDDAVPDDNDGITSQQVFVTPVGSYDVTELVPQGWDLDTLQCSTQTGASTFQADLGTASVTINLAADDTVECIFENVQRPVGGFCPVDDDAVGFEMTDLLGRGMGSPTRAVKRAKLVLPNAGDLTALYGQLAAVDIGIMKWVRFSDGSSIQINAPTSPAYQTWAVDWWGTELTPGSPIKGAFFTGPRAAKAPRGMVLWPTYETETEYANVFTTFDDSLTNHVYWNTAEGWVNEVVQIVDIPETQAAGANITVKVALVDNQPDDRPVVLTVTPLPGGTPQTLVLFGPNVPGKPTAWQNTLNLETILLENVPAGVNQIEIKLFSPDPYDQGYETGPNGGDSVAMIGAAANYLCDEEVLDGFVNVAIDVFNR